jgi:hypothetical protein
MSPWSDANHEHDRDEPEHGDADPDHTRQMNAVMFGQRRWTRKSMYGSAAREQPAREVHELVTQQWLERHSCTELVHFRGDCVIKRVVASDDGHWRVAMPLIRAQPSKKFDAVDEWHPEVDKNCIRTARLHGTHPAFRRERRPHVEPFQTEHLRKNVGGRLVIVHDEHGGRQRRSTRDSAIVSSALSRRPVLNPLARRYSSTGLQ